MTDRGTFADWFTGANSVADAIMADGIATDDVFIVQNPDITDPSWTAGTATYTGAPLDPGDLTSGWWDIGDWNIVPFATTITAVGSSTGTTYLSLASITGGPIPIGATFTGTGVPANARILGQASGVSGGNGAYITNVPTTLSAVTLTFTPSIGAFPSFVPILPPPQIQNPPPPTFPPTTGSTPVPVPLGPLVGPAIAAAGVPPSTAGIVQPQYRTGSATAPTAASWFPSFSAPSNPIPPVQITNTPPPTMLSTLPRPVNATGIP